MKNSKQHIVPTIPDECEECMRHNSNVNESNSYIYPYKYDKMTDGEVLLALAKIKVNEARDILNLVKRSSVTSEGLTIEDIVKLTLAILEEKNDKFQSIKAINPRNYPLVYEITNKIIRRIKK